jgi:hypothetical protein
MSKVEKNSGILTNGPVTRNSLGEGTRITKKPEGGTTQMLRTSAA